MESSKEKEIIIIGGGIAGLSAGIYAMQQGDYRATILEMGAHPGGQLTAWNREGYQFDYCLQWLVGSRHGTFNEILREIGAIDDDTQVIDHDVFLKMVDETHGDFYVYGDMDRWEKYLKEMAPEDSKGIHKLCSMVKKSAEMDQFQNPPGMRTVWEYLQQILKGWRALPMVFRYVNRTIVELMDDLKLTNTKLRYFIERIPYESTRQLPGVVFLMVLGYQHDKNAGYLKGGSAAMTQRIVDTYTKLGGSFKFQSKVKEIIVEDNTARGVILESGERLLADHVISACDGHTVLYDMLGGKYLPPASKQAYETYDIFDPFVMVSFGINKTIRSDAHEINYLGKHLQIGRTIPKYFSILNRSMYDDVFAPEGKSTLELCFLSPWDNWKDMTDVEYAQEKEDIKKCCTELLEEQYPGILEHVEVVDIATPRTEVQYTGVWKGSFEGFEPGVGVIGKELPIDIGLNNFSMAGQWVIPGGGLPPSAQSGRWAIQKLVKKDKKKFKHYVSD